MLKKSVEEFKLELKKYKDNELLLLKYPDLYCPAEINEGELNVVDDMQNQINANKHRIGLLDSLNKKLSVSIKKLNEKRESIDQSFNKSNSKLDLNETNEIYETLLYGFSENSNVSIVKNIENLHFKEIYN